MLEVRIRSRRSASRAASRSRARTATASPPRWRVRDRRLNPQPPRGSDPLSLTGTHRAGESRACPTGRPRYFQQPCPRSRSRPATAPRGRHPYRARPVRTPAFVPLASTATVKSLHASEVAELGYDMVLGNTFHLFIQPGHELIAELGGLHEFMGWRRPIITDSGGYQVFSMGHGSVAEEIKRNRDRRQSMVISIEEEGVRFRSYADGRERFMGPETSMEVQAGLGSDIALAFDECTPFHVERDYTAASMERTAPLARPLRRLAPRKGARRAAHLRDRPGRRLRGPPRRVDRVRRRRRRGRDRDRRLAQAGEGADARGGGLVARRPARGAAAAPARDRRRGRHRPRRRRRHRHLRLRHARPGWPATGARSCTTRPAAGGST